MRTKGKRFLSLLLILTVTFVMLLANALPAAAMSDEDVDVTDVTSSEEFVITEEPIVDVAPSLQIAEPAAIAVEEFVLAAPAAAAIIDQTIYLKGSGSSFDGAGWTNPFPVGGAVIGATSSSIWHLVYTGNDVSQISYMQLTFTNGFVFEWTPAMDFSRNSGGNNPGWVIIAPYDWEIAYVNSGNSNESGSYLITSEGGTINFNISGFTPGKPDTPTGSLWFQKTVDGTIIANWYLDQFDPADRALILAGISFQLFPVSDNGVEPTGAPYRTAGLNGHIVDFGSGIPVGWYAIKELLTGRAAEVFEDLPTIWVYVSATGNFGLGGGFDYNGKYTIINGYGSGYVLGLPNLNNSGDIFPIGVMHSVTGDTYISFCAHAGSTHFAGESGLGCSGYMVAFDPGSYPQYVSALNYIYDKYGDFNSLAGRAIVQAFIWWYQGKIDVNSPEFNAMEDWKLDKAALRDTIAHYQGYVGSGAIADVVYMVCEQHHDYKDCQPQLVVVFNDNAINNKVKPPSKGSLRVAFDANEKNVEKKFQILRQKTDQEIRVEKRVEEWQKAVRPVWKKEFQGYEVPTFKKDTSSKSGTLVSRLNYNDVITYKKDKIDAVDGIPLNGIISKNGFTAVRINVAQASTEEGLTFQIADSSMNSSGKKLSDEYNTPIGYSYKVNIKDGKIIVSFDDRLISAGVYAEAWANESKVPQTKKGEYDFTPSNGTHQKNGASINLPANSGTIILFVHLNGVSWFTTGEYKFVGWVSKGAPELVSDEKIREDLVSDVKVNDVLLKDKLLYVKEISDDFVRNDFVSSRVVTNDYDLTKVTMTVTGPNGQVYSGPFMTDTIGNLAAGDYTVVLSSSDFADLTRVVTVVPNQTAVADFGVKDVWKPIVKIYLDPIYLDPIHLDPLYRDPIYLEKRYLDTIYLDKTYDPPFYRPVIRLGNDWDPTDPNARLL